MRTFADTSFLCALYRSQDNTDVADRVVARFNEPLCVSSLVALELRQSARLQVFRFASDRTQGFSKSEADKILRDFDADISSGVVQVVPAEWGDVHSLAERISGRHTMTRGHRTLDVIHVATAIHAKLGVFLTFDENQAILATAEGLEVMP